MIPTNKKWQDEMEEILKELDENGDGVDEEYELPDEFFIEHCKKYGINIEDI
jgi:hypothetical protein